MFEQAQKILKVSKTSTVTQNSLRLAHASVRRLFDGKEFISKQIGVCAFHCVIKGKILQSWWCLSSSYNSLPLFWPFLLATSKLMSSCHYLRLILSFLVSVLYKLLSKRVLQACLELGMMLYVAFHVKRRRFWWHHIPITMVMMIHCGCFKRSC